MYSQNDSAWVLHTLGFGPDTIGAAGCYLASDADLMTWAGHPMNPDQLNDYYKANGIYVQSELLADTALHDAFPALWVLDGVYHCESFPCDQNQLNNDDPNLYVIVELMGPGGRTHFSPVLNWRQWTIADTWTGQEQSIGHVGALFGWGTDPATLIGKAVKLRYVGGGSPAPPPPSPPPAGTFQGVTCPIGVHVRLLPGSDQPLVAQPGSNPDIVDGGTTLTFDAWCHHAPKGGADVMPTDFWTNQPDDRWFRTTAQHWVASAGIKGNPPVGMNPIDDPAAAPAPPAPPSPPPPSPPPPPPAPVNKTVPAELKGVVVWETSPTFGGPADYAWLKANGVSSVLVRGRNGDGTGRNDATFEQNWTTRAAAARAAGLPPVLWTYWYGPSEGVTGDVAAYLKGCAEYTAKVTDTPAYVVDAEDRNLPGLGAALLHLAQLTGKPVLVTTFGDPKTAGVTWDWASIDPVVAAYEPQMYTGAWGSNPTFKSASAEWPQPHAPFLPANDETDLAKVASFVAEVKAAGLEGVSFWYYKDATSQPVIKAYLDAWKGATPPPPSPPPSPTPPPPTPPPDPSPSAIYALLQKIWELLQKIAAFLHVS